VVSWKEIIEMTEAFEAHQVQEAWVVIWPEHLLSVQFLQGVNLPSLAADYQVLTGKSFPATVPPLPVPMPAPQNVVDWLVSEAERLPMEVVAWIRNHL
jgi:hypothetical protein